MTTQPLFQPPEMKGIGTRLYDIANGQKVAFTGTTGQSAALGATTQEVCLYATADCYIVNGTDPTATSSSFPLPANLHFHIRVYPDDKIAVIAATGNGDLYIMPVL